MILPANISMPSGSVDLLTRVPADGFSIGHVMLRYSLGWVEAISSGLTAGEIP